MDIITLAKLKKCISIDMNAGHSFATTTDRDTFFTNNPTQLKADMYIYCNGQLQQYVNSAWEVRSTAIQGSKGDNGDNGITPHIDLTTNNWFIDTIDTGVKAVGVDGVNGTNGINGADGIGVQTVIDNGDNTFTVTLTNGAFTVIDKIDTINSDVITQGTTNLFFTTTEKNKLTSIEENAEVNNISDTNATDLTDNGDTTLHYHASDRDRTNHTGAQAISTVTGLQTSLDNKANKDFTSYTQKSDVDNNDKIAINDSVDNNSIKYVTLNQLISSVQDPHNKGYYATGTDLNTAIPVGNNGDFAVVGATNTIWVWDGTAFVDSSASGAVLSINGETGIVTLTKNHIGLDNVVNLDTSTTANITDTTDKRFVTDANLVIIGNTSNTNTGDETNETIKTKLGTDLSNKVDKVDGKELSANDFTTVLKNKLAGIADGANNYTLPAATTSVLGGVKVDGTSITIADGVISAPSGGGSYTLPIAATDTLGGIKPDGTTITVNSETGVASVAGSSYSLPAASAETLGGVKVGAGLSVTAEGELSASGGGGITQTLLFDGATNTTDVYTLSEAYTGFKFLIISAIYTSDKLFNAIINCADIRATPDYSKSNSLYIGGDRLILFNTNGINFKTAMFAYCKIYGVN